MEKIDRHPGLLTERAKAAEAEPPSDFHLPTFTKYILLATAALLHPAYLLQVNLRKLLTSHTLCNNKSTLEGRNKCWKPIHSIYRISCCLVAKSWPTFCDPMDYTCQDSLSMEFFQSRIFPTEGSNHHLMHWQGDWILYDGATREAHLPHRRFSHVVAVV